MVALLADENFNGRILEGVLRHLPAADVVRVQDVGLSGVDDPTILQWAAEQGRIVLSHDFDTMIGFANDRIIQRETMPGLFAIRGSADIGLIVEQLMIIVSCSESSEWGDQVTYLPWT